MRLALFLAPLAGSIVYVHFASGWVEPPTSSLWLFLTWWFGLSGSATLVLFAIDRLSRRLLPLAALLKLSLIFPDELPSRFKTALRAGNVDTLEKRLALVEEARRARTPREAAVRLLELVAALNVHDQLTHGHSDRVRAYSLMIGKELGLSRTELDLLNWAALLHDIGKLEVPPEILTKPGKPTDEEWEVLRQHPLFGEELALPLAGWLGSWSEAVGYHHERWDGRGYPRGVAADEIPFAGRIVAVADVFDVITSARSYKHASNSGAGREEIARCAGAQFDPRVVRAFLSVSLGRMRLIMGPLSWLSHAPLLGRLPLTPAMGVLVGASSVVSAAAVGGLVAPPTIASDTLSAAGSHPPAHRLAKPAIRPRSPLALLAGSSGTGAGPAAPASHPSPSSPASPPQPPAPRQAASAAAPQQPDDVHAPEAPAPGEPPPAAPAPSDPAPEADPGPSAPVQTSQAPAPPSEPAPAPATSTPAPAPAPPEPAPAPPPAPTPSPFVSIPTTPTATTPEPPAAVTSATINQRPSFTAGPAETVLEDAGSQTLSGWATGISPGPPAESGQTVSFTVTNDNPSLFSSQPAIAADGALSYRGAANANGLATVTVRAVDDGGTANGGQDTSAAQTFAIKILPVNDAPSFVAGAAQSALETAGAQTASGWGTAVSPGPTNESGQAVGFTVTNDNNSLFGVQPAVAADGTLTYTPLGTTSGVANVTVRATDDGGTANGGVDTSAPQTFTITIVAVNHAPSFNNGGAQTAVKSGAAQSVAGWATAISAGPANESGQTVSFTVTNDSNGLFGVQPAVAADGTLTYTPAPAQTGVATVTVRAVDNGSTANGGADTSAPQTFTITILWRNLPPSFVVGANQSALSVLGAQTVPGWATAIDPGSPDESGQTVSFTVTADNPGLFSAQPAVASDGTLTYTPALLALGTTTVTVTAHDNGGTANGGNDTSASQTFTISIL